MAIEYAKGDRIWTNFNYCDRDLVWVAIEIELGVLESDSWIGTTDSVYSLEEVGIVGFTTLCIGDFGLTVMLVMVVVMGGVLSKQRNVGDKIVNLKLFPQCCPKSVANSAPSNPYPSQNCYS